MPSLSHPLQFVLVALAGWFNQQQRDDIDYLLEKTASCAKGKRFLIHDRDPRFTLAFRETLAAADVQAVRLPPRSPNLNHASRYRSRCGRLRTHCRTGTSGKT